MANPQNNIQEKTNEAAKANIARTVDQGERVAEATQQGVDKIAELREQTTENARQIVQTSIEAASHQAREVGERFTRNFGFNSEDSQKLADQSKQNLEAIARCGTVLTQAFQDVSRSWFDLNRKQWQRNLDGLNRLTRSRSAQEFSSIQSDLFRENLQNLVQDGRGIAERSLRAAEDAGQTFANVSTR